jgi:hypothetical protein
MIAPISSADEYPGEHLCQQPGPGAILSGPLKTVPYRPGTATPRTDLGACSVWQPLDRQSPTRRKLKLVLLQLFERAKGHTDWTWTWVSLDPNVTPYLRIQSLIHHSLKRREPPGTGHSSYGIRTLHCIDAPSLLYHYIDCHGSWQLFIVIPTPASTYTCTWACTPDILHQATSTISYLLPEKVASTTQIDTESSFFLLDPGSSCYVPCFLCSSTIAVASFSLLLFLPSS